MQRVSSYQMSPSIFSASDISNQQPFNCPFEHNTSLPDIAFFLLVIVFRMTFWVPFSLPASSLQFMWKRLRQHTQAHSHTHIDTHTHTHTHPRTHKRNKCRTHTMEWSLIVYFLLLLCLHLAVCLRYKYVTLQQLNCVCVCEYTPAHHKQTHLCACVLYGIDKNVPCLK